MTPRPFLQGALVASAALALAACATVPRMGPAPQVKPAATYATTKSFSAPALDWPSDRWWTAYGDAQLDRLIEEALAGSPDLAKAQARVRRAEAFRAGAASELGPHVNAAAAIGGSKQSYNNGIPREILPQGWQDTGMAGITLDWNLDLFGKNRALLAAARSEAEAARADEAQARLTLSSAIAATYADLAKLYADRDAAEEALRVRADSEGLIASRYAQGLETQAALERAHAGRATAKAELEALDEAIGLTRDALAALMGAGPDRGLAIARPQPGAIHTFGLPENIPAGLLGRRPDVIAARLAAEAAQSRIKAAKAAFYPDVNLAGIVGWESIGLEHLAKAGSSFGAAAPAVTLPIFDSGRLRASYRGARAEYDEAVAAYDATLTQALKEVADGAVSARALDARLADSVEALNASRTAYGLARQRYGQGLGTYLDVLTAEDALIANQRAVADLETRAFALDIALVRALGGGFRA